MIGKFYVFARFLAVICQYQCKLMMSVSKMSLTLTEPWNNRQSHSRSSAMTSFSVLLFVFNRNLVCISCVVSKMAADWRKNRWTWVLFHQNFATT